VQRSGKVLLGVFVLGQHLHKLGAGVDQAPRLVAVNDDRHP
jgi:hypothetical protein